mmetsp:Transcript_23225/g.65790  ORF Transcript_23225/g.65790 Transcript_23225/m.65790 type:complete len:459 (-) Transcript_23225:337-1713(-)
MVTVSLMPCFSNTTTSLPTESEDNMVDGFFSGIFGSHAEGDEPEQETQRPKQRTLWELVEERQAAEAAGIILPSIHHDDYDKCEEFADRSRGMEPTMDSSHGLDPTSSNYLLQAIQRTANSRVVDPPSGLKGARTFHGARDPDTASESESDDEDVELSSVAESRIHQRMVIRQHEEIRRLQQQLEDVRRLQAAAKKEEVKVETDEASTAEKSSLSELKSSWSPWNFSVKVTKPAQEKPAEEQEEEEQVVEAPRLEPEPTIDADDDAEEEASVRDESSYTIVENPEEENEEAPADEIDEDEEPHEISTKLSFIPLREQSTFFSDDGAVEIACPTIMEDELEEASLPDDADVEEEEAPKVTIQSISRLRNCPVRIRGESAMYSGQVAPSSYGTKALVANGQGIARFATGATYAGSFQDGKMHGKGIFHPAPNSGGATLVGTFMDDEFLPATVDESVEQSM